MLGVNLIAQRLRLTVTLPVRKTINGLTTRNALIMRNINLIYLMKLVDA